MSSQSSRRKKPRQEYNILVVPGREGGKTRSFRATRFRLWSLVGGSVIIVSLLVVAALTFTPLGYYVSIPNPELEQRYGVELVEMQQNLNRLAEDVVLMRDYNTQLRRALGEAEGDSAGRKLYPISVMSVDEENVGRPDTMFAGGDRSAVERPMIVRDDETEPGSYVDAGTVGMENMRAALPLLLPTVGVLSQGYDPQRNHHGMDFAGKRGTPVYAATDGYVVFAGWTHEDGNMIMLSHGSGYLTVYKHNQSLMVVRGGHVRRGDPLALLGDTGVTSGGPHLHFELWKDGIPLDPAEFLLESLIMQ